MLVTALLAQPYAVAQRTALVAQVAARPLHQPRPLVRHLAHLAQPVAQPFLRRLTVARQAVHRLDHEYDGVAVTAQLLGSQRQLLLRRLLALCGLRARGEG